MQSVPDMRYGESLSQAPNLTHAITDLPQTPSCYMQCNPPGPVADRLLVLPQGA